MFQFRPYHGTQLYNEIVESGRKISLIRSNENSNVVSGRAQFNFQSGNYSEMEDALLNDYKLKTQSLSEVGYACNLFIIFIGAISAAFATQINESLRGNIIALTMSVVFLRGKG